MRVHRLKQPGVFKKIRIAPKGHTWYVPYPYGVNESKEDEEESSSEKESSKRKKDKKRRRNPLKLGLLRFSRYRTVIPSLFHFDGHNLYSQLVFV